MDTVFRIQVVLESKLIIICSNKELRTSIVSDRFLDLSIKNDRCHEFVFIFNIDIEVVLSKILNKELLFFLFIFVLKYDRSQGSVVDSKVIQLYPRIKIVVSSSSFLQGL